jgi:hypothetical protein
LVNLDDNDGGKSMNGKSILRLIVVVGLAKMAFGAHRQQMGAGGKGRDHWLDRVADVHRELHRRDAAAEAEGGSAPAVDSSPTPAEA